MFNLMVIKLSSRLSKNTVDNQQKINRKVGENRETEQTFGNFEPSTKQGNIGECVSCPKGFYKQLN